MPELPEVETIARTLTPLIANQVISGVSLLNEKTLEGPLALDALTGRRIVGARRRGKLLLIDLEPQNGTDVTGQQRCLYSSPASMDSAKSLLEGRRFFGALRLRMTGRFCHAEQSEASPTPASEQKGLCPQQCLGLAVHLRMTGRLFVFPAGTPPSPHTRAILDFEKGERLFFDDARKFGRLRVLSPESYACWAFWNALGPEPLEITGKDFVRLFKGRGAAIKALLLDQSVIAGIGNIYADESLFRAGIAPFAPANTISEKKLLRLHKGLKEILLASIEACGSSIRDYRTARGDAGAFQNAFQVYGRKGQPCRACGTILQSCRVAGRTTVWCPLCQGT